jgi:hypothetical protein
MKPEVIIWEFTWAEIIPVLHQNTAGSVTICISHVKQFLQHLHVQVACYAQAFGVWLAQQLEYREATPPGGDVQRRLNGHTGK